MAVEANPEKVVEVVCSCSWTSSPLVVDVLHLAAVATLTDVVTAGDDETSGFRELQIEGAGPGVHSKGLSGSSSVPWRDVSPSPRMRAKGFLSPPKVLPTTGSRLPLL